MTCAPEVYAKRRIYRRSIRFPSTVSCPESFLEQYRFDRWLDVLEKAVRAALTIPKVRPAPLAVIGESEGALMAAHLAGRIAEVSHVALFAPTAGPQLAEFADARGANTDRSDEECHRDVEELFEKFERIFANPTSTSDWWQGHPFQRWATFATRSTLDGLLQSRAQTFLIYGTDDDTAGADRLRAGLVANGRDVTARRVLGADHRLTVTTPGAERDIRDAVRDVTAWLDATT